MKVIIFLSALFVFGSCSYKVVRTGYKTRKSEYKPCDIVIKKYAYLPSTMQKVGEVQLKAKGNFGCSENDAIALLKNEACSIDANLINITDEDRPDFESFCYRCKAEFYKVNTSDSLVSDQLYSKENLKARNEKDKNKNVTNLVIAVSAGLLLGLLLAAVSL